MAHLLLHLQLFPLWESSAPICLIIRAPLSCPVIPSMQHGQSRFDSPFPENHFHFPAFPLWRGVGNGPIAVALEYLSLARTAGCTTLSHSHQAKHSSAFILRLHPSVTRFCHLSLASLMLQQPPCSSPSCVPCQAHLTKSPSFVICPSAAGLAVLP